MGSGKMIVFLTQCAKPATCLKNIGIDGIHPGKSYTFLNGPTYVDILSACFRK